MTQQLLSADARKIEKQAKDLRESIQAVQDIVGTLPAKANTAILRSLLDLQTEYQDLRRRLQAIVN